MFEENKLETGPATVFAGQPILTPKSFVHPIIRDILANLQDCKPITSADVALFGYASKFSNPEHFPLFTFLEASLNWNLSPKELKAKIEDLDLNTWHA